MGKKIIPKLLISVFLVLFLATSIYLLKFTTFFKQKAATDISNNLSIQTADQIANDVKVITSSIISFSKDNSLKQAVKPEDILNQRITDSATRKEKMLVLLEKDVTKFLEYAVPEKVITNYDSRIKNNFEKEIEISGEIENLILENFEKKESRTELYLKSDGKRMRLFPLDKSMETIPTRSIVKINGFILDNKIAVSSYTKPASQQSDDSLVTFTNPDEKIVDFLTTSPTQTASSQPTINKKIAVVLFNFENKKEEPWTVENIKKWTFTDRNSVAGYYKEASFGKLNFTGDVFGWITLPISLREGSCSPYEWSTKAKEILSAQGINLDTYDYVINAFPRTDCGPNGWAEIKGRLSWIDGSYELFSPIPSYIYLNSNATVVIHEIGHNLGTHHANSLECKDSSNTKVAIDIPSRCISFEYGDPFDVMGTDPQSSRHFNAYHKGQVGWFNTANLSQVTKFGKYNIFPQERNLSTRVQSLRIPAGLDQYGNRLFYYLEYRRPFGIFDNFATTDKVVNGVSIRLGKRYFDYYDQVNLIDTTANTYEVTDSALSLNQTFDDNIRGIKIKTTFVGPNYATIEYSKYKPPCVRSKPDAKIFPIASWGKPGESLQYSLELTNNDSPSCGASIFKVNPVLFSDWRQYPENLSITVKPLERVAQTFFVSSSSYNPTGYFTFREGIRHPAGGQYNVGISANYNVYYSDVTPPEIIFINPVDGQTVSGGYQKITLSITDKETAVGGANIFYDDYQHICNLMNDCWFDFSKLTNGSHILKVDAYDVVNNSSHAQINFIVEISSPTPTSTATSSSTPSFTPSSTPSPTGSSLPPTLTPTPATTSSPTPKPT